MKCNFLLFCGGLLLVQAHLALGQCRVAPGGTTVVIPLQNAPNSFEPACQPARIRVRDRVPVTLRLTGLSPLDICLPNSKPQAVTSVTNPIEAIINTVSGLKSFSLGPAVAAYSAQNLDALSSLIQPASPTPTPVPHETAEEKRKRVEEEKKAAAARQADEEALKLFRSLARKVIPTATEAFRKQNTWQNRYQADVNAMNSYLAQDYRGPNYSKFQPETDAALATVRSHVPVPQISQPEVPVSAPTEADYAPLQALVDEMSSLQGRLIDSCTKTGQTCDADILQTVGDLLDSAKAILAVAQDNLKTLQTMQASVASSYVSLDKVYLDFQNRLTSLHSIAVQNNVLLQDIHLGADYGQRILGRSHAPMPRPRRKPQRTPLTIQFCIRMCRH